MRIIERIVVQDWYETEYSKAGWDSHDWIFKDDKSTMTHHLTVVEHLDSDKHYNTILGIAEKE